MQNIRENLCFVLILIYRIFFHVCLETKRDWFGLTDHLVYNDTSILLNRLTLKHYCNKSIYLVLHSCFVAKHAHGKCAPGLLGKPWSQMYAFLAPGTCLTAGLSHSEFGHSQCSLIYIVRPTRLHGLDHIPQFLKVYTLWFSLSGSQGKESYNPHCGKGLTEQSVTLLEGKTSRLRQTEPFAVWWQWTTNKALCRTRPIEAYPHRLNASYWVWYEASQPLWSTIMISHCLNCTPTCSVAMLVL